MKKMRKKYYMYLCRYHYNSLQTAFMKGNIPIGIYHQYQLIKHEDKYYKLGGEPEDIFSGVTKNGRN